MKFLRLVFVYLFILTFSMEILAQGKFSLGIDAGIRNEKARFDDPKGYIFRDLWPSGTIGLAGSYDYNDRWNFELGIYRTTFNSSVSAYYNEPGYFPMSKVGDQGGGGFSTLQIPLRAIYFSGIGYKKLNLHFIGGIVIFHQIDFRTETGMRGSGTPVFPQPAPNIGMEYTSSILNRTSIAIELGPEIRYQLTERFYLAYRFSGTLGTREKVSIEGLYEASNNPDVIHDFEVVQRGTSLNHFLSLRYRLGKKVRNHPDYDMCRD